MELQIRQGLFKNKKLTLLLVAVGILVLGGVVGFIFQDAIRTFAAGTTATTHNGRPTFVLDTAAFPDWVTSGNTYQGDVSKGEPLHTVLMVNQCESGSNCSELMNDELKEDMCQSTSKPQCEKLQRYTDAGHCMVHVYHINRPINPDEAIADFLNKNAEYEKAGFTFAIREIAVKKMSIDTPEGDKTYQLHQYDSGNESGGYKNGVSLGYVPLKDSHVEIKGICDEPDQLDEVLPVLAAVRLTI